MSCFGWFYIYIYIYVSKNCHFWICSISYSFAGICDIYLENSLLDFYIGSELLSKFGEISFQDYVSQGITHPVFYGDLVYKLRRVKGEASGSKIVKRLRRRQYDQAIIERHIGLVLGPFTALYRSVLKRCTLTNKAVGTIWRALSKPPQRRQGPDPRPLWLLFRTPSAFGPVLAYRLRVAQPTLMDVTRYFWYTFILLYMSVYYNFYDLSTLVGCLSSVYIRRIIYKLLNVCTFDYTAFVVSGKVGYP